MLVMLENKNFMTCVQPRRADKSTQRRRDYVACFLRVADGCPRVWQLAQSACVAAVKLVATWQLCNVGRQNQDMRLASVWVDARL
jgi:hypothetical protein